MWADTQEKALSLFILACHTRSWKTVVFYVLADILINWRSINKQLDIEVSPPTCTVICLIEAPGSIARWYDTCPLNFSKNIVSLVHHGAYCALVVHIAPFWCTSTPYTVVVVYNVPWVNPHRHTHTHTHIVKTITPVADEGCNNLFHY